PPAGRRPGDDDAGGDPAPRAVRGLDLGGRAARAARSPQGRARRHLTEVSADWVLPVDGQPLEGGLVRFEDGAIVEVTQARPERHFEDGAIVPGFVNAHSHLEYAVYAGFGDGKAFGPWIRTHVDRKDRLDAAGMLAIARRGVLDSLAAGITTTADYSF